MRVLALDTTTRRGSEALVADDRLLAERSSDGSSVHAARLPGALLDLLAAAGLAWHDVDLYAVACGPGSFTGLRIGIATMQGLAFANQRPLAGVSALEAIAQAVGADAPAGTLIASWLDAYRREVFSALYRVTSAPAYHSERLEELEGPAVGDPAATLARWQARGDAGRGAIDRAWFAGDGANEYAQLLRERTAGAATIVDAGPLAGAIARIAAVQPGRGADPAAIRPLYVRRPDAEVARELKQRSAK